jgi:hypothetical protein
MEPTIYKPGAYKTPGVYNGAGGIYKGSGVYKYGTPNNFLLYTECNKCVDDMDVPIFGPTSNIMQNYEFLNPGYSLKFPPDSYTLWQENEFVNFTLAEIELLFGGTNNYTYWIYFLLGTRIMHTDYGNGSVPNKNVIRFQNINNVTSNVNVINEGSVIKYVVLGEFLNERYKIKFEFDGEFYKVSFGDNYEYWIRFKTSTQSYSIGPYLLSGSGAFINLYKVIIEK